MTANSKEKTIQVLLGFKEVTGGATIVGDPNSWEDSGNDFWKSYTDAKNLVKAIGGGPVNIADFRRKFQNEYDQLQAFKMDAVVEAEGKVCGYQEFSYETGELKFSEGGALLAYRPVSCQLQLEEAQLPNLPSIATRT